MSKSDQYDLVFARCGNMSQSAAANPRAFEMARAFEMVELPASKWRRLMLQAPIARGNCKVRSSGPGVASNANLTFVIFRQAAKTMHRSRIQWQGFNVAVIKAMQQKFHRIEKMKRVIFAQSSTKLLQFKQ
ncbi:hypothetical protein FIBSPDRAFT_901340 [Athelia psychrophila]|uniref:Uncharacterized protein n=1 Tax=Athelia psychrophila TaxID=1759441 RepID=A0A165XAW3_9AGAM|nr:hypothetical protein FIBSPDRAFT_901340 [Fibularhizoctonia sp. CBS 109695]